MFLNQLIEFYLNNTINRRPLTPHIMSCYTHKMAIVSWPTSLHPMYMLSSWKVLLVRTILRAHSRKLFVFSTLFTSNIRNWIRNLRHQVCLWTPLILTHPVLSLALPPSVRHSHHPSPLHSFIPGLKPSFSANPSHRGFPFLLRDGLNGSTELFTDTSYHIRFLLFSFSVSTF